jgi:hypothetical protein
MECNKCQPCGPEFMQALTVLRKMGTPTLQGGTKGASETAG